MCARLRQTGLRITRCHGNCYVPALGPGTASLLTLLPLALFITPFLLALSFAMRPPSPSCFLFCFVPLPDFQQCEAQSLSLHSRLLEPFSLSPVTPVRDSFSSNPSYHIGIYDQNRDTLSKQSWTQTETLIEVILSFIRDIFKTQKTYKPFNPFCTRQDALLPSLTMEYMEYSHKPDALSSFKNR